MSSSGHPVALQFTEKMRGFVTFGMTNYEGGYEQGRRDGTALMFQLTIKTSDTDQFVQSPTHEAEATGYVQAECLGGKCLVQRGIFNLFVETGDANKRKMLYRLFLNDPAGRLLTLSGYKSVQDEVGLDVWKDTTTLFVNLFEGHIAQEQEASARIVAAGILHIQLLDFLEQLTTFRTFGPNYAARAGALVQFNKLFLGSLWQVYGPSCAPRTDQYDREIPLYTTEGVRDAEITTHPFSTADKLGLSFLRYLREPCNDVVVILHGLTTSSDMFIMPEQQTQTGQPANLVSVLLDQGFTDVITLDFRMSNRFSYNLQRHRFNMDDVALYDYPPAFAKIRELVGPQARIHVICHCLGSVSFMMSLFGKAVTGIRSVISNSVSLTPRIPSWSRLKLRFGPFLAEYVMGFEYLNPFWRRQRGLTVSKLFAWVVSQFHRECNVPECHMLSFLWGTGFPALYRHENLLDVTHRRGGDLYGGTSMHYYRHVLKMVTAKNTAVKFDPTNPKYALLPDNYLQHAHEITTPVLFMTGEKNEVFTDSNIVCHDRLQAIVPGRHELHVFPNYGHQDVFMGKSVDVDVFPRLIEFLRKNSIPERAST